jgi:hypothetical protein
MKPEEGSTAFNFASSEPVMLSDSRLEAFLDGSVTFRSDEAGMKVGPTNENICTDHLRGYLPRRCLAVWNKWTGKKLGSSTL